MFRCFLVSTLLLAAAPAMAEEIDWPGQIAGLDGVTVGCDNANMEKYAAKLCSDMTGHVLTELGKANIAAADLGSLYSHEAEEPAKPGTMATPLKVTIFVRATDSNGKMQPMLLPGWNPKGYLNNACHRIAVKVV